MPVPHWQYLCDPTSFHVILPFAGELRQGICGLASRASLSGADEIYSHVCVLPFDIVDGRDVCLDLLRLSALLRIRLCSGLSLSSDGGAGCESCDLMWHLSLCDIELPVLFGDLCTN